MWTIESEGYNSNDDVNDDVFVEKQHKKAYQVDYNVLGSLHLKSKQDKEVSQVSLILGKLIFNPQSAFNS